MLKKIIIFFIFGSASVANGRTESNVIVAQSIEVRWHSFTSGSVTMSDGSEIEIAEFRKKSNNHTSYLMRADSYVSKAKYAFWRGLGAGVVAALADNNRMINLRTAAVGSWGILWTGWIGYGALAQAEMDDASFTLQTPSYAKLEESDNHEIFIFNYSANL